MEIEVVTISQELIKPSTPTPDNLKLFKLSLLDQLFSTFYLPFIFFYPSKPNISTDQTISHLKSSLSSTLSKFYPIAGRIKDSTTIDCNDEGVVFIEAKVQGIMFDDFLKPPRNDLLNKLLPCGPLCVVESAAPQICIKANVFSCGGIALGISFLHKLIDATTFGFFIKSWAEISHDIYSKQVYVHHNITSSILPPNQSLSSNYPYLEQMVSNTETKIITKRFLFEANSISSLKSKGISEAVPNPTRAEVISGFIWKCLHNASQKSSVMVHLVNIRPRLNPPLTEQAMGNVIWRSLANDDKSKLGNEKELPYFVALLRKSIREVNSKYLEILQGDEGYENICKLLEDEKDLYSKSGTCYVVISLSRMGFYEANFGFGKPIWVSLGPNVETVLKNVIFQTGSMNDDEIEAWVLLDENEMKILENDQEFLSYAKLNPDVKLVC